MESSLKGNSSKTAVLFYIRFVFFILLLKYEPEISLRNYVSLQGNMAGTEFCFLSSREDSSHRI
jgi:hypothetical protein